MYESLQQAGQGLWLEGVARAGYFTKGVLYLIVGGLAVMTAVGFGHEVTDSEGAVRVIAQQPLGILLLWLTAGGLFAYAAWCMVQATFDPESNDSDAARLLIRASRAVSALVHASLGIAATQMAMNEPGAAGGSSWLDRVLSSELGELCVVAAGAAVIIAGGVQIYRAYAGKFRRRLKTREMSRSVRAWVVRTGRLGLSARGVVFLLVGIGLIKLGLGQGGRADASLEGALRGLSRHTYGDIYLGAVAFGLSCYGLLMMVYARYRRLPSD